MSLGSMTKPITLVLSPSCSFQSLDAFPHRPHLHGGIDVVGRLEKARSAGWQWSSSEVLVVVNASGPAAARPTLGLLEANNMIGLGLAPVESICKSSDSRRVRVILL